MNQTFKKHFFWGGLVVLLFFVVFFWVKPIKSASCALNTQESYKTRTSRSVYYISTDCKKRPILNPAVFFSHFRAWSEVNVVSATVLRNIPDHELSFLPWGPRRTIPNGTLIKTVTDPKVYLKLGANIYPIDSEAAFLGMGFAWNWIEDVDPRVVSAFTKARIISDASDYPAGLAFKYTNNPRVYLLEENSSGNQRKRHVQSVAELRSRYREDRVATLPTTDTFNDGEPVEDTTPTPDPVPTPEPVPAPPSTNNTPSASAGSAGISDFRRVLVPTRLGLGRYPTVGAPFTDSVFGTTMLRFTGETDKGEYATHDYSQLQAFSTDNKYVLLGTDKGYEVFHVATRASATLAPQNNVNVARWQPDLNHTLVWIDSNEDETIRVQYANVDTGAITTHYTFPNNFDRIRGNQSFDELSDDGRWMGGMAAAGDDDIIFSLDLRNKRLGAQMSLSSLYSGTCALDPEYGIVEPDWVGISPLGNYLVVNWARDGVDRCSGQEIFDVSSGRFLGHSYDSHAHGDLALTKDGQEVFVTTINASSEDGSFPAIVRFDLPNGYNSPTLIKTVPWHAVWHISCRGPRGMCLVTSFPADSNFELKGVLEDELYMIYFDGSVRRLGHHRSSGCGYWVQPRASISRDARYAIFDSDFWVEKGGRDSCTILGDSLGGGEVFMLLLPDAIRQSPNNAVPFVF
jgi:hypothetical protein